MCYSYCLRAIMAWAHFRTWHFGNGHFSADILSPWMFQHTCLFLHRGHFSLWMFFMVDHEISMMPKYKCDKMSKETKFLDGNGTLLRKVNGSSSFCKGPRTSKVWKSKDPKGPRTFRLKMSSVPIVTRGLYFFTLAWDMSHYSFLSQLTLWCKT